MGVAVVSRLVQVIAVDRDGFRTTVRIEDEKREGIVATFTYTGNGPRLASMSIEGEELAPATMRSLPWPTWERTARAAVMEQAREDHRRIMEVAGVYDEVASLHPELTDRRSARSHARLVGIAREYRKNLVDGVPDPVGAIARAHDVKPVTARSWVHRARKEGYLDPAAGPVAGEVHRQKG